MTESPDEDYRRAAVDLLGAIAYGELSAFERLAEDAKLAPTLADKVLMVDGGSGYLAELVRPLVGSLDVVSPAEAGAASRKGGYTLLLIDGAAEELPAALVKRLADDGRVVGGVVRDGLTRLATGRKAGGVLAMLPLAEIGIPVLPEFAKPKGWSF